MDGDKSYYEWLKGQPGKVQEQVLGKKRAALFQSMDAKKFGDLQFDKTWSPLTLDEMQKIEPVAFERAGIFKKAPGAVPGVVPKVTSKRAKELARRAKVPMAQELLDLEAGGMDLGDNLEFFNLMPKSANYPLQFRFPTDQSGKKAYFQKWEREGVMIEVNSRFSQAKGSFPGVLAHETGHAIDNAWGWTQGKRGRDWDSKSKTPEFFPFGSSPNLIFVRAWEKSKKIINKNGKAANTIKYSRPQNGEFWSANHARQRAAKKTGRDGLSSSEQFKWAEQEGALSDTIMALTNSRHGGGHKVSYMKDGAKEKEFMAHAFENYFVGNPAFELHEPELYKVTIDMMEALIKETNKINK